MTQTPETLMQFATVFRRLDRIEKHIGLEPLGIAPEPAAPPVAPAPVTEPVPVPAATVVPATAILPHPMPVEAPPASHEQTREYLKPWSRASAPPPPYPVETPARRTVSELSSLASSVLGRQAPPSKPYGDYEDAPPVTPTSKPSPALPAFSLERFIGGRFFAVAGGLIVTLGVGYFLKLAYDWGWFTVPPAAKCLIAAGFGAALLGLGELARRKINAWASAGLSSAGVATLMAAVYAAHGVYGLIDATAAFALLVLAAVAGGVVAWVSCLPVVAAVSMIGAYLAPVLVRTDNPKPLVLPVYLSVLLALGLWTAWKLSPKSKGFAAVRAIAWAGTAILGTVWCATMGTDNPVIAMVFLLVVPLMVHAELVLTGRRIDAALPQELTEADVFDPTLARTMGNAGVPRLLLGSVAANAWAVMFATWIAREAWPMLDWLPAAGAMTACGALAVALAGHLHSLKDRPRTALGALGAVLAGQSAGMMIVVVSLALSGWTQSLAWLGMGIGACIAGRWVRVRAVEVYGFVLMLIGTVRITLESIWAFTGGTPTPLLGGAAGVTGGAMLSTQAVMLALAGVAWLVASRVLLSGEEPRVATRPNTPGVLFASERDPGATGPRVIGLAGALIGFALLFGSVPAFLNSLESALLSPMWVVLSVLAAVGSRFEKRMGLSSIALLGLPMSAMAWAVCWSGNYFQFDAPALIHPGVWTALCIAASAVGVARLIRDSVPDLGARRVLHASAWVFAGLVAFVSTNLEVSRSAALLAADTSIRGAALSVYWSACGLGLVMLGFGRRVPVLRHVGLGLMSLAAAKVLVFDLSGVGQVWRVVSTVGVGLLMIGVAMVYSKVSERIERAAAEESK
jgi:uncharacterized membrane protein